MRPRHSHWPGRGLAALYGLLSVAAYPDLALSWLAWIALAPLLILIGQAPSAREAAARGWWGGWAFFIAAYYWLLPNLTVFLPLAAALLALTWFGWAWVSWHLLEGVHGFFSAGWAATGIAATWVCGEIVRSWQWLGGPWGLFGTTQWHHPVVLGIARAGGTWAVSFVLVLANAALAMLWTADPYPRRVYRVVAPLGLCLVLVGGGIWVGRQAHLSSHNVRIGLIQPGITTDTFSREIALSQLLRSEPLDLVVWGETSVDEELAAHPQVLTQITKLAADLKTEILIDVDAPIAGGAIAKTATLISGAGVEGTYRKNRLVPFGEYIPFRPMLGWLSHFTKAAAINRVPGTHLTTFLIPPHYPAAKAFRIAPLTSFEETFPDLAQKAARLGAQLITYQSSTSTFQGSWAPDQLASFGALRAAESGIPNVQAALTGTSSAYTSQGGRIASIGQKLVGAFVVTVPLAEGGLTPAAAMGGWGLLPYPLLLALALVPLCLRRRRSGKEVKA